ncbi:Integrase core domain containing protein [Dirofilaria immitis]|nr:Integrase core domain containing protein [Dirofilaria immitis]
MPDLPESRVKRSRTFTQAGLNYLGPLSIRSDHKITKNGAVHLELVENLSAENFLHVLRRFVALHGYPELVLSDNTGKQHKEKHVSAKSVELGTPRVGESSTSQ